MKTIAFPLLGIRFQLNPIAFNLFGKDIYWYGIILSVAFIVGLLVARYLSKWSKITQDDVLDVSIIIIPLAIIGARIYYVLFKIDEYKVDPSEVFKIWHGGLAIYGGIIASIIGGILYCKIRNIDFFRLADVIIPGLIIGQAIGRWGNFVNAEAYGYHTQVPWKMEIIDNITNKSISVHPTFLYESLLNLLIFVILFTLFKKRKFDGQILNLYMILYGLDRFFIEGLRSDSLYLIPNLRISQLVSLVFVMLGVQGYYTLKKMEKNR